MSSYLYRKYHCGDKTVVRSSHLHNEISYTGKMTYFYWIRALTENQNSQRIDITRVKKLQLSELSWTFSITCSIVRASHGENVSTKCLGHVMSCYHTGIPLHDHIPVFQWLCIQGTPGSMLNFIRSASRGWAWNWIRPLPQNIQWWIVHVVWVQCTNFVLAI